MTKKKRKQNQKPLTSLDDLKDEVPFESYNQKACFEHICTISVETRGKKDKEYLQAGPARNAKYDTQEGIVYIFVIDGKIFKIGQSMLTFKERLDSYNSGRSEYREQENSTNSGTNYVVMQSVIKLKVSVEVYGFFPPHKKWKMEDEEGTDPFPPAKRIEKILLKKFIKSYGKPPIGCSQT